jgi:drug/metabolite transporter (DMT)-like permease
MSRNPSSPFQHKPAAAPHKVGEAVALMCLAITLFSCLDASAKYLATVYGLPVEQLMWSRFFVQFIGLLLAVPLIGLHSLKGLFTSNAVGLQIVRSVLMAATTLFNFLALQTLRLDQTVTIVFLSPLVVALLAGPLLGEWVGWRRMMAVLVGFCGILIVVRPGMTEITPAFGYAFLAMFAYALFMLLTRYMSGMDPPLVTLFYSMFAGTLLGAPFAAAAWTPPPDLFAWALLCGLGVLGGLGHYLFIHAYSRAPASMVSPFLYVQLLSMVALGYLVFDDIPDLWTLAGACVVIGSGIYLFQRERITRQQAQRDHHPS